jgi:TolB-like protein
VLPFRALNPADANLVDAIWDDTRGALSHNPNLRVLGRQSVTALAEKDAAPADYRKKVGADYLLDADVQHVGDQIQLKLSLTRTKDGAEVWNDQVGGKLDDVFGFQQRVAREVEGRIRGRVAPAGGATARNIATSPEAYALYAQARALILKRGNGHGAMGQARELLRKVLAIDPNYAPAWADLGQATGMSGSADGASEASRYLRRALQLAPNLGHAHAALAMVQGMPPELEGELRKAIAIDPNDAEAWMWLGNCLSYQNRTREALEAYSKAIEIEPLLYPAAGNKIGMLGALHDAAGLAAEQKRVERLGDPLLLRKVKIAIASATGHPGDVVRMLLELKASHSDQTGWVDNHLWASLRQLGFFDEFAAILNAPSDVVAAYRDGDPGPPDIVKWGYENKAIEFWKDDDAPALMGRLLFKKKRTREYRQFYHAAFTSADQLADGLANPSRFPGMAPTIACVLRASGDGETAQDILSRADTIVSGLLKHGPATADLAIRMAQIRAAEGADEEAMSWLNRAVSNGWLPDRSFSAIDIADEPAFARLAGRPQFQALRQKLIARIAEERAKVPAQLLARAFPVQARMAA